MTGVKVKFMSLNLLNTYHSVKITDGSHSLVLGNGVVHATSSLTITDVLYVPKFSISLLSINQFTKHNIYKITFPLFIVFQGLSTGRRIGSGRERGDMYYLDDRVTPIVLVAD